MLIREIMDQGIAECTEDVSLSEVYDLIHRGPADYVVVLDSLKHRVPIGIVSEHSICESIIRRSADARKLRAGGVMSANVKLISEDADVLSCLETVQCGADALLVIDARRKFMGVVDPRRVLAVTAKRPALLFPVAAGHSVNAANVGR
jgi:predicted transcriptional regulator